MMFTKRQFIGGFVITLLILVSGCNAPTATPDLAATVEINVAVAQTSAAIQTKAALTQNAELQLHPTQTATPEIDLSATAASQYTATPDKVMVTLTRDTYCRTGAASSFPSVALLKSGESYEVLAQNPSKDTYFIVFPPSSNSRCWLWGEYTTLSSAQTILPVITSIPMPTATKTPAPQPDFSVSYVGMENCGGDFYFRFLIRNTGKITWQSLQINLYDVATALSATHTNTSFVDSSGCAAGLSQSDLSAGEEGNVAAYNNGQFAYDPTGHSISATFTLCQTDAYGGCINKSINFVP